MYDMLLANVAFNVNQRHYVRVIALDHVVMAGRCRLTPG